MKHIFLLEDDETLGRGIVMALTGPETSVLCQPSLAKAREALAEERFDLLILDINLPTAAVWTCCGRCVRMGTPRR